ncbi:NblA/ycf18 family protein [Acaryochloris marina]|uniref:Phycobilisome degradation family protein domain n=1 Tax=Acaryochloris marina (strain MBIC 11017) TaxID=329726 RepID=A8ZMV5_ACAM1|nr:NblA/ycf18 family protein [Acaryochloris marina]ABW32154.1 phycobilisome degradation family protein domain [Acaryochloris marina MBIC11017]
MDNFVELSLEQKFSLQSFEYQVQKMSKEQAQDFLIQLYKQMIIKETMYKQLIKQEWDISKPFAPLDD